MQVFIKVRRRLNIANVVLFGSSELPETLYISANKHELKINQTTFSSSELSFINSSFILNCLSGSTSTWFRVGLEAGMTLGMSENIEIIDAPDFLPRF